MAKNKKKEEVLQKWEPILNNLNIDENKKSWLSKYAKQHQLNENNLYNNLSTLPQPQQSGNTFPPLLPIVMRVSAKTIAGGGWNEESEERISRRKRIQKLKRILDKKTFEDVVSKAEYDEIMEDKRVWEDGLVSVQPMSAPTGKLFYMDFKYGQEETPGMKAARIRKEREEKIKRIFGQDETL